MNYVEELINESLKRMAKKYEWFSNERQFEGLFVAECYLIMNEEQEKYSNVVIYPEYSYKQTENGKTKYRFCDVAFIKDGRLTPLELKFKTKEYTFQDKKGNWLHCGEHTKYNEGKEQCCKDLDNIESNLSNELAVGDKGIKCEKEGFFLLLSEEFGKNDANYVRKFVSDCNGQYKYLKDNWKFYSIVGERELKFLLVEIQK